jgi:hypothetical protein
LTPPVCFQMLGLDCCLTIKRQEHSVCRIADKPLTIKEKNHVEILSVVAARISQRGLGFLGRRSRRRRNGPVQEDAENHKWGQTPLKQASAVAVAGVRP